VKPTPVIVVDEPAKGLIIQGQTMRKPTASNRFWSSRLLALVIWITAQFNLNEVYHLSVLQIKSCIKVMELLLQAPILNL
jgi:hypothetical protein